MRLLIFTLGSRGDVQPYLGLAVGLQRAGHQVTLATSAEFTPLIESYGVGTHPVRLSMQAVIQTPEARAILAGRNPIRQFKFMQDIMVKSAEAMEDFWEAAQTADCVVQTGTGNGGIEASALRGVPLIIALALPFPPTSAFPSFFWPVRGSLGGGYNYLTHQLMHAMLWRGLGGPATNRWRMEKLNLPPWRSYQQMYGAARATGTPWLFGYSPTLLPKPADWADYHHVTGYWYLDPPAGWQPPAELQHFLAAGPPPVYIGFGSMADNNPERLTRLVFRALELSGQRGVLLTGWGGLTTTEHSAEVYFVEDVPHAWLLPQTAAVVHHGGAGTTGAVLRAGVPGIATPIAGDQYAWAECAARLGVGPRAPNLKALTAETLAAAITTAVSDPAMRGRAAEVGEQVRAEDGVGMAVGLIERHAQQRLATAGAATGRPA